MKTAVGRIVRSLDRYWECRNGNVLLVTGAMLSVVVMPVAMALDYGRSLSAKTSLQHALDAATLAGANALQGENATPEGIEAAAQAIFQSFGGNVKTQGLAYKNFKLSNDAANEKMTTSADVTVSSFVSLLTVNAAPLTISASSTVSYSHEKIEAVLVLDLAGGMSVVPPGGTKTKLQLMKDAATTVVGALLDDSPSETAVRIGLAPFAASVNAGALASAVSDASPSGGCAAGWGASCVEDACVVERLASHYDADPSSDRIPALPKSANWQQLCPRASVVPLQGRSKQRMLTDTIASYSAGGNAAGHIGAAWGWYLLSENWASVLPAASKPAPVNDRHVHKHVIFMSAGQFNTAYLGDRTTTAEQKAEDSYSEFQFFCDAMKDQGKVTIWTVGFDLDAAGTTQPRDELVACSGADHFFDVSSGADLKTTFRQIVGKMRSVRVSS